MLSPFNGKPKLKTFVVITIIPFFSNACQFWLTYNVIMRKYNEQEVEEYKLEKSRIGTMNTDESMKLKEREKEKEKIGNGETGEKLLENAGLDKTIKIMFEEVIIT